MPLLPCAFGMPAGHAHVEGWCRTFCAGRASRRDVASLLLLSMQLRVLSARSFNSCTACLVRCLAWPVSYPSVCPEVRYVALGCMTVACTFKHA